MTGARRSDAITRATVDDVRHRLERAIARLDLGDYQTAATYADECSEELEALSRRLEREAGEARRAAERATERQS